MEIKQIGANQRIVHSQTKARILVKAIEDNDTVIINKAEAFRIRDNISSYALPKRTNLNFFKLTMKCEHNAALLFEKNSMKFACIQEEDAFKNQKEKNAFQAAMIYR